MTLKQKIKSHYIQYLDDKIASLQSQIADLTADAQNDAKGSAGDKHETALSMIHLEQEKLNHKVTEFLQLKNALHKIDVAFVSQIITMGSLVKTDKMLFFISVALPKITLDNFEVIALSPQSPLGSKLVRKKIGDEVSFNNFHFTITGIE